MLSNNSVMLGRGSLLTSARESLGLAICTTLEKIYNCKIDENGLRSVSSAINQPPAKAEVSATELGLPTMSLRRFKPKDPNAPKGKPNVMKESEEIAVLLQQHLVQNLTETDCTNAIFQDFRSKVAEVSAVGSYLNFSLRPSFLGSIVDDIITGDFVKPMPQTQPKVMVEFSQPNTHKAFHVGHMRNVALGDAVSRIYSMLGFQVTAANYFGDEGAHVAKCLWLVEKEMSVAGVVVSPEDDDETVSTKVDQALKIDLSKGDNRAEALGKRYADATDLLALDAYTSYPGAKGLIAAKVLSKAPHDTNPKWNVVQLQIGPDPSNQATVVCGGLGYNIDDVVAYAPVGIKFNKKAVIPMPMQGVTSCGIMAAYKECGAEAPADVIERTTAVLVKEQEAAAAALAAAAPAPAAPVAEAAAETGNKNKKQKKGGNKKGGNKKNKEGSIEDMLKKQIFLVSSAHSVADSQLGAPVTEFGRVPDTDLTDLSRTVEEQVAERVAQTGEMLQRLESGEPAASRLWDVTKQWSLDEFHSIYNWLGAHFDVDFFESMVSHESKQMCLEYFKQGLLNELEGGAIGADLGKLGVLVLVKSNGTGLYATKDIALAKRKFEEFGVDRSIYVVDSSQMLHFQQLFKTLEMVGFEQASRCAHLKYGQVVLPDGKMSSRKGNVVFFSDLKKQLTAEILRDFMYQYTPEGAERKGAETGKDEPVWDDEEIATSTQRIAVATIRYRMLNNDPIKTIEFDLAKWSAKSGNTGPYLMYTLCRAKSILRKVPAPEGFAGQPFDVSYLSTNKEWGMLMMLSDFWTVVNRASGLTYDNDPNPGVICMYAYELASMYMSWVQVTSVINAQSDGERMARLMLVEAVAKVLKACLNVIGIEDIERM